MDKRKKNFEIAKIKTWKDAIFIKKRKNSPKNQEKINVKLYSKLQKFF